MQGDVYELFYNDNLLYVISGYYEDDKCVYKSNIKSLDCKSLEIIHDTVVAMDELKINSYACYVNIVGDYAVFFGQDLGISYYSVNLFTNEITYLGDHSSSVSCTDDKSIYYLKSLNVSSIYNTEVKDELWKLDVSTGQTTKIADYDIKYYEMICTDNYIYLYKPIKLFPEQNTLFNLRLGYEIKQVEKTMNREVS